MPSKYVTKIAIITFTGQFPLDMLRHDRCAPHSSLDAALIHQSIEEFSSERKTVKVIKNNCERSDDFTIGRWNSFNCAVELEGKY